MTEADNSNIDSVGKFLNRESVFSRDMRSPHEEVVAAATHERMRRVFGEDIPYPSEIAVRTALKPMVDNLGNGGSERLVLLVTNQDVIDARKILDGGVPTYARDTVVTRSDVHGELHDEKYLAGSVRRAPIPYVIANNLNAIRPVELARAIGGKPADFGLDELHGQYVQFLCSTLSINADYSKTPDKALATLKEAVGEGRQRAVAAEMSLEVDRAKIRAQAAARLEKSRRDGAGVER